MVVLDAISSNIPIVTFNTRGGDEIVLHGKNGFIVNDFNFKLFAEKIFLLKEFEIDSSQDEIKNTLINLILQKIQKK